MAYFESDAVKDTMCDSCGCELPKGIDVIIDDDTGSLYCGIECWENEQPEGE